MVVLVQFVVFWVVTSCSLILVATKNMEECGVTSFNVKASLENRHVSRNQCYWFNKPKSIYFTQHTTFLHGRLGVKCSEFI